MASCLLKTSEARQRQIERATRAVDSFSCGMKNSNLFDIFTSSAELLDLFPLFCWFQVTIIAANRPLKVLIPVHPVQNPALAEESVSDSTIRFFPVQNNKMINLNKYTLE